MTKVSKNGIIDLNNVSIGTKEYIFSTLFSTKTNTAHSFEHKIELITLICYLTQQLKKRFPEEFRTVNDTIFKFVYKGINIDNYGDQEYIVGITILCEDLLYGVSDINKPEKYNSAGEVKDRIKELFEEWMPF